MTSYSSTILYDAHDRVGPWVAGRARVHWDASKRTIGLERNGGLVAGVIYEDFNGHSVRVHQCIADPHAVTRRYIHDAFAYPFIQLGCRVVIASVPSPNRHSARLCERLGFECAARIPDAFPGGDLLIYTMRREQCRFLSWRIR